MRPYQALPNVARKIGCAQVEGSCSRSLFPELSWVCTVFEPLHCLVCALLTAAALELTVDVIF